MGNGYRKEQMKKRNKSKGGELAVVRGSGNVFVDLGFSKKEAGELAVKAELTRQICNRIKELGLTQIVAAERLGVSQPDVSKLMNGRYTGYSIDRLISLLNALEMDIDIVLRRRGGDRGHRPGVLRIREVARAG
jgi:predicted XRE-type DNA-binding protein